MVAATEPLRLRCLDMRRPEAEATAVLREACSTSGVFQGKRESSHRVYGGGLSVATVTQAIKIRPPDDLPVREDLQLTTSYTPLSRSEQPRPG